MEIDTTRTKIVYYFKTCSRDKPRQWQCNHMAKHRCRVLKIMEAKICFCIYIYCDKIMLSLDSKCKTIILSLYIHEEHV